MRPNFLYIFQSAPYGSAAGQEGLDALLSGVSMDLSVAALFVGDGVFQLKSGQLANAQGIRQYSKAFAALSDFGVEQLYVDELALQARGLQSDDLTTEAKLIDAAGISQLISQYRRVLTF